MSTNPTVDNTWGAALIGLILASILYGITILQSYNYFTTFPNDCWGYKLMAATALLLDSTSLALISNGTYGILVSDINNPLHRLVVNRAFDVEPALMGLIAFLTHLYLGLRVWKVCNRNLFLALVLAGLMTASLALALAASVVSFRFKYWSEKEVMKPLALAGTVLTVILDGLIASVLCIYLSRQNIEGKKTRRIVRRVLVFAINTGLASSIMATIDIVTFIALPNTMIFLSTNFIFTKVYANALFANLNARDCFHECSSDEEETISLNLSALRTNPLNAIHRGGLQAQEQSDEQPLSTTLHNDKDGGSLSKHNNVDSKLID